MPSNETLTDPDLANKKGIESLPFYLKRIEERYDVKAARKQFEAMDEEVSIAKGAHWPSLDFTGNYYLVRPEGFMEDFKWDFN